MTISGANENLAPVFQQSQPNVGLSGWRLPRANCVTPQARPDFDSEGQRQRFSDTRPVERLVQALHSLSSGDAASLPGHSINPINDTRRGTRTDVRERVAGERASCGNGA
jgi:hypothetical protein